MIWNILGSANKSLGKIAEASRSFKKVITLNPRFAEGFNNLALVRQDQGKLNEALKLSKKALQLKPNSYIFYTNKGIILQKQGKLDESIEACKKALSLNPKYVDAYFNLGVAFQYQGKQEDAIHFYKKLLSFNQNYTQAYSNLAVIFKEQGKLDKSIEACKKSILIQPDYPEPYNNLGAALRDQGKFIESIEAFKKAISLQPNYSEAYNNLAIALKEQGNLEEAIENLKKALLFKPDYPNAYYNLSFPYNLKGDLQKGLELYEWRLKKDPFPTKIPRDHLIWDGKKPVSDKKFFVYEEQGLGDTIQFCRYLSILKQKGAEVIFKVKPKMHTLLETLDEDIILVDSEPDENSIDFETPLMSLPFLFDTTLKSIPSMISYLSADHNRIVSWKKRLAKDSFKVGICWQGSKNKVDFERSFSLTLFENISKLTNVELISLHKGEGEKQIQDIKFNLTILGDDFDNGEDAFVDTAAVMANCDLIITSDTAIAHLAGALGRPTWVVLKKIPDWRWMLDRNDSPWYPSMKLYRQTKRDNWEEVFETMKKDLQVLKTLKEN
jgi:tetratricopeptide (TPR) repeat protein